MAAIPIIRLGGVLIATVLEELRDRDALDFQSDLMDLLEKTGAFGVLIDLSNAATVDSFLGRLLNDIAVGARLLGARTVIAGMQPAVAVTLTELGLQLRGVRMALNVEKGMALLGQAIVRTDQSEPDLEERISLRDDETIVTARQLARNMARELGMGRVDQARVATAVSELARNVIRYATGSTGEVLLHDVSDGSRTGLEIVVSDQGPGIADVEQVLTDGYTTGGGLGMGLPGTRRLTDEMLIDTALGKGTIVTIRKWCR